MALFDDLERVVSNAVDGVFGDPIRIVPKARGQYLTTTDPARPARTVVGIWDMNPVLVQPLDKGQYDASQPDFSSEKIHVSIDTHLLGPPATWPVAGDTLERWPLVEGVPTANGAKATVSHHQHDGVGRTVFICVPVK